MRHHQMQWTIAAVRVLRPNQQKIAQQVIQAVWASPISLFIENARRNQQYKTEE